MTGAYVFQALFEELFERGLTFISKYRKNMKNTLAKMIDKILRRKRAIIESVNDHSKTSVRLDIPAPQPFQLPVNLLSGLTAHSYHPKKPALSIPNLDPLA